MLNTLILCPLIVVNNWAEEFEMHSTCGDKVQCLTGSATNRIKQLCLPDKNIFITNYEAANMRVLWSKINNMHFEAIVLDESHRVKNPLAKRTKKILEFAASQVCLQYRYILSGTPVLNSALDLWSQYNVLDPDILGENYYAFRARYFRDVNAAMPKKVYFPNWKPISGSEKALNEKLYSCATRVRKKDVLDLPPITYQKINVIMGAEQTKIYNSLRDDLIAFLKDKTCAVDLAITKVLRLQQLVSGIFTDDKKQVTNIEHTRNKVLLEVLDDIPSDAQKIIWAVFTPSYTQIKEVCEKLSLPYVYLTGKQTYQSKINNVKSFNEGKTNSIIANPAAGGLGINLIGAPSEHPIYMIYYSRTFSLEQDLQSESRAHRGGQEKNVTRIDLVTRDTVDEQILQALKNKWNTAELILKLREKLT